MLALASAAGLGALALLLGTGAACQWLASRLRLPAILLLLAAGFALGPGLGVLEPDALFGPSFRPLVALAVGLILFEGGLSLRLHELRGVGKVVRNLVSVGALVTWALSTLAGVWIAGVPFDVALLVGAILVLTGPTVVVPLVRHVRPQPPLGAILRWEGILIDPIGAVLALLVLQALTGEGGLGPIAVGVARTLLCGGGLGLLAGWVFARGCERYLVPDALQVPMAIGTVAVAFAGANWLQPEAGLLAVTAMGMVLGNRQRFDAEPLLAWLEPLTAVLLAILFLCIAARLPLEPVTGLGWRAIAYTVALVLVVRPVAVLVATLRSNLRWAERSFLMAVAPRGIVVAAVSSEFSLHYEQSGRDGGPLILALVFPVILISVLCYGLGAGPVARRLGIAQPDPQGLVLVGADPLGRELGRALQEAGATVLLVDTNAANAAVARTAGLPTWHGSVLSSRFTEEANLDGIGGLLALTPSAEVNRLALRQFQGTFDRARLFAVGGVGGAADQREPAGRIAFAAEATLDRLRQLVQQGGRVRATRLTEQFGAEQYAAQYPPPAIPLFVLGPGGALQVVTADQPAQLRPGCTVLTLAPPSPASP